MSDNHLLPRYRKEQSAQTPASMERTYTVSSDEKHIRLRGIPVLAQGVGGAQLGTRPERAVLRLDK